MKALWSGKVSGGGWNWMTEWQAQWKFWEREEQRSRKNMIKKKEWKWRMMEGVMRRRKNWKGEKKLKKKKKKKKKHLKKEKKTNKRGEEEKEEKKSGDVWRCINECIKKI